MLYVLGGVERLAKLASGPVVLIAGSGQPSDYGIAIARSLARGLAAAGIAVLSSAGGGIALAAQVGALEVGGPTIAVTAAGLGVAAAGPRRAIHERVVRRGCVLSELPCDRPGRIWGAAASERVVARLSRLTVIVEAGGGERALSPARLSRELGRTLAAVPGRVTSPLSTGTNALLMEGARLVRDAEDVLELLYPLSGAAEAKPDSPGSGACLPPRLRTTLERIGTGCDTPEKLTAVGQDLEDVLLELSELELLGLVGRGDGGRYVPRCALPTRRGRAGY